MRKFARILMLAGTVLILSACSFLDEVNGSINYVETATTHIEKLSTFAEEAPALMQEAVTNPEVQQELETQLTTLKTDVETFINLGEIPAIADTIHQELVSKNEFLLEEINKVLENGHLALDQLENSQLITTANEITILMDRIKNLER